MAPHDVRAGIISRSRALGSVTGKHLRRDFLPTTSRAQLPYGAVPTQHSRARNAPHGPHPTPTLVQRQPCAQWQLMHRPS